MHYAPHTLKPGGGPD